MPAADPITAVANAISAALGIAAPLIAEHEAQAHEQERIASLNLYADAAADGNVDRMHVVFDGLLAAAGRPVGTPSKFLVTVGAEYLDALAGVCADAVKTRKDLNSLAAALKKT